MIINKIRSDFLNMIILNFYMILFIQGWSDIIMYIYMILFIQGWLDIIIIFKKNNEL